MLNLVILAATLWVCPGEVYTNEPRDGCKPFQQSNREGFSVMPQGPREPAADVSSHAPAGHVIIEQAPMQAPRRSRASEAECARYREWLDLSRKTENMGAHTLEPNEFQRWQVLREQYSTMDAAACEDQ
jgi:hypothetical protein